MSESEESACTICLSPMSEEERTALAIARLPCGHEFHCLCIMGWTFRQQNDCPICRRAYLEKRQPPVERRAWEPTITRADLNDNRISSVKELSLQCLVVACLPTMMLLIVHLAGWPLVFHGGVNESSTAQELLDSLFVIPEERFASTLASAPRHPIGSLHLNLTRDPDETVAEAISFAGVLFDLILLCLLRLSRLAKAIVDLVILWSILLVRLLNLSFDFPVLFSHVFYQSAGMVEQFVLQLLGLY